MSGKKMIVLSAVAMYASLCIFCICLPTAILTTVSGKWHAIYWIGGFFASGVNSVIFYASWGVARTFKKLDDCYSPAMLERAGYDL